MLNCNEKYSGCSDLLVTCISGYKTYACSILVIFGSEQ